jgi:hypothetical protein
MAIKAGTMVMMDKDGQVKPIGWTTRRCSNCKRFAKFIFRGGYGEYTSKCCNSHPVDTPAQKSSSIIGVAMNDSKNGQVDVAIRISGYGDSTICIFSS